MYNSNIMYNTCLLTYASVSGGIAFFILDDLNKIYCKKSQYYATSLNNFSQLMNTGFFIGFGLGLSYVITGKPLAYNLIKDVETI